MTDDLIERLRKEAQEHDEWDPGPDSSYILREAADALERQNMTQAAEHIVRSAFPDVLERLVKEAVAEEREACAAIWESVQLADYTPKEIAAAIRARKP